MGGVLANPVRKKHVRIFPRLRQNALADLKDDRGQKNELRYERWAAARGRNNPLAE